MDPTQGGAVTYWDGREPQSMTTERHAADHTPKLSKSKPRMGQQWGRGIEASVTERTEWKSETSNKEWNQRQVNKQKLINESWMQTKRMDKRENKNIYDQR